MGENLIILHAIASLDHRFAALDRSIAKSAKSDLNFCNSLINSLQISDQDAANTQ